MYRAFAAEVTPAAAAGVRGGDRARAGYELAAGADPAELPMRWSVFVEAFAAWVRWYNAEHAHSGLGGRSPAAAWAADVTPLRLVLLADVGRTIRNNGTAVGAKG